VYGPLLLLFEKYACDWRRINLNDRLNRSGLNKRQSEPQARKPARALARTLYFNWESFDPRRLIPPRAL
jgi:hypothetical protein